MAPRITEFFASLAVSLIRLLFVAMWYISALCGTLFAPHLGLGGAYVDRIYSAIKLRHSVYVEISSRLFR